MGDCPAAPAVAAAAAENHSLQCRSAAGLQFVDGSVLSYLLDIRAQHSVAVSYC
jgi:hypothetical protein